MKRISLLGPALVGLDQPAVVGHPDGQGDAVLGECGDLGLLGPGPDQGGQQSVKLA